MGVEQEVAPSVGRALAEFPGEGLGQGGEVRQEIGLFLLRVDDGGVPVQVEAGHARSQQVAPPRGCAPFRLDGAQLGQHGVARRVLRVELDHADAGDDGESENGERR